MNTTQELGIRTIEYYIKQMAHHSGQSVDHMQNSLRVLKASKLTEKQLTAIANLMKNSFNLCSNVKI